MDAVIFDMDGVVVDSESHWKRHEAVFLEELLGDPGSVDRTCLLGLSVDDLHAWLARKHGLRMDIGRFRLLYGRVAEAIYRRETELLPGFKPLAEDLLARGVRLALASSSPARWITLVIERFSLAPFFETVVSADELGGQGKPSPAIYRRACERLDVDAERCVAIEDSRNGVVAAKRARLRCVGLRNGFNEDQDFSEADLVVQGLGQLNFERLQAMLPA